MTNRPSSVPARTAGAGPAKNETFLKKAENPAPKLFETEVRPVATVAFGGTKEAVEITPAADFHTMELKEGDRVILDFGTHYTGHLSVQLSSVGDHPDAPAWIRFRFAERPVEFFEDPKEYKGWIARSWIQQEETFVDVFPAELSLSRRYAMRYLMIEVVGCSTRYRVKVDDVVFTATSSADDARLQAYAPEDPELQRLDAIAVRTLHECMQTVFEDGPKRDRRLWLGDLRLQALCNYETYGQNDLIRRCLYLFAAAPMEADGRLSGNLFLMPEVEADDCPMVDYALFFVDTLLEYVRHTDDRQTLSDLYETAMKQIDIAREYYKGADVITEAEAMGLYFVDWNLSLEKTAAGNAIYIYSLNKGADLADLYGDAERAEALRREAEAKKAAAYDAFFDEKSGVFVSGKEKQVSMASQVWMTLAGVVSGEQAVGIMEKAEGLPDMAVMVSPYMYHHYVQALIDCGAKDKALSAIKAYWGAMADEGADTYFELFNPENPAESPYGGTIVNSYCHAWSCGPCYFLRKYFS